TCSPASPSIQPTGSTTCCRGTGGVLATSWAGRPDDGRHPLRLHDSHVAKMLGEDEEWLREISINMDPEEGCLWVIGVGEDGCPAFTEYGIECLKQIIIEERALLARERNPNT